LVCKSSILNFRKKLPPVGVHCGRVLLECVVKIFNIAGIAAIKERRLLKCSRKISLIHLLTIVQLQPLAQSPACRSGTIARVNQMFVRFGAKTPRHQLYRRELANNPLTFAFLVSSTTSRPKPQANWKLLSQRASWPQPWNLHRPYRLR
jgi:hypothetical protein